MAKDYSKKRSANYGMEKLPEPSKRMGSTGYANLPDKPMYMSFSGKNGYRDGIVNNFTCDISEVSGIEENGY